MKKEKYLIICELPDGLRSIIGLMPEITELSEISEYPFIKLRPHIKLKASFDSTEEEAVEIFEYLKDLCKGKKEIKFSFSGLDYFEKGNPNTKNWEEDCGYVVCLVDGVIDFYKDVIYKLVEKFPDILSFGDFGGDSYRPHITIARNVSAESEELVEAVIGEYKIFGKGRPFSVERISMVNKSNGVWGFFRTLSLEA